MFCFDCTRLVAGRRIVSEYEGEAFACPFIEGRVGEAHREEYSGAPLLPKD
jgi:hypothetical protein